MFDSLHVIVQKCKMAINTQYFKVYNVILKCTFKCRKHFNSTCNYQQQRTTDSHQFVSRQSRCNGFTYYSFRANTYRKLYIYITLFSIDFLVLHSEPHSTEPANVIFIKQN